MTAEVQDVVKANLVLVGLRLLSEQEELNAFRHAVSTDVQIAGAGLIANILSGVTEPGRILTLERDRITLELSPSRSTINRDYPLRKHLDRLAEVAWQAIDTSFGRPQPSAFGFNVELVFEQDSGEPAFGYLSRRLFDVGPLGDEGWRFVGGAGRLVFNDSGNRWTINLEPRFNDDTESRVFLGVNVHMSEQPLPDQAGLATSFEGVWDGIHEFVERLDKRQIRHG